MLDVLKLFVERRRRAGPGRSSSRATSATDSPTSPPQDADADGGAAVPRRGADAGRATPSRRRRRRRRAAASGGGGGAERAAEPGADRRERDAAASSRASDFDAQLQLPGLLSDQAHPGLAVSTTTRAPTRSSTDDGHVTTPTSSSSTLRPLGVAEYYGVMGTTWTGPADPRQPQRDARDRRPQLPALLRRRPAAGGRLARPTRASYWVTNTLTAVARASTQMLGDRGVDEGRPRPSRAGGRADERERADRRRRRRLGRPRHRRLLRRARPRGPRDRRRRGQGRRRCARGEVPIHEPGLAELRRAETPSGFTSRPRSDDVLDAARLLFCCVDTPPTYSGDADLSRVRAVVDAAAATAASTRW